MDLEILCDLAILAELRLEWAAKYQVRDIIEEFSTALIAELDYSIEGRNSEKIGKQFQHDPLVTIPMVYWAYSTKKILTMEYINGVKLNDPEKLLQAGNSHKILAGRLVNSIFKQILVEGFFHGDPHPGNVMALPGDRIAFLDFGMIGRLSPEMKYHLTSIVIAMMRKNTNGLIKAITHLGLLPDTIQMTASHFNNKIGKVLS